MKVTSANSLILSFALVGCFSPAGPTSGLAVQKQVKTATADRPNPPQLEKVGKARYRLCEPWKVNIGGKIWRVPTGYSSNGITAPNLVKASLGNGLDRPETWAAVFHDWLFTQKGISRSQADKLFHQLLLAYGVPPRKAAAMYAVVSAYSISIRFR
jgi:Protein of unknown function (DUF1353)